MSRPLPTPPKRAPRRPREPDDGGSLLALMILLIMATTFFCGWACGRISALPPISGGVR